MGKVSVEHKYMGKTSLAAGVIWRTDAASSGLTSIHGTSIPECWFLAAYLKLCTIAKKFISSNPHLGPRLSGHCFPDRPERCTRSRVVSGWRQKRQRLVVLDLVTGKLTKFQALSERLKEIISCRRLRQLDELRKYGWHVVAWENKIRLLGMRIGKFDEDLHACSDIVTKEYSTMCRVDLNCKDSNHIMLIHDMSTKTRSDDTAPNGVAPLC